MFDERDAARRRRAACRRSATRFAGRGSDINYAIRELNPLLAKREPVLRNLAEPADRPRAASSRRSSRPPRRSRRSPRAGRAVRQPRRRLSARSPTSPTRTSRRRSPRARRRSTRRSSVSAVQRPCSPNTAELFTRLPARRRRAARTRAPTSPTRSTSGTPALRRLAGLQRAPRRARSSASQTFAHRPARRRSASRTSRRHGRRSSNPTIAFVTPAQTVCNYFAIWSSATSRACSSEGGTNGQVLRFSVIAPPGSTADADRSEQRGLPVLGTRERAGRRQRRPDQLPARQPVPVSPPRPASRATCEAGNEKFPAGKPVIGNVPGRPRPPSTTTRRPDGRAAQKQGDAPRRLRKDRTGANPVTFAVGSVTVGAIVVLATSGSRRTTR